MTSRSTHRPLVAAAAVAAVLVWAAVAASKDEARPVTAADLPTRVKAPDGFEVTLFAAPPVVRYPTSLSAGVSGELFVAVDENGSLDARPDRGRVLRCLDPDGDGRADRCTEFATMDSPRGVDWDGRTLYVMHPP